MEAVPRPRERARTAAGRGLLVLGALAFTLAAGEGVVRVAAQLSGHRPIVVSDAGTGWAARPDLEGTTVVFGGARFRLSTDELGRRRCYPPGERPPDVPALVLVGDSFTQGIGVDDDQTFGWSLARDRRYRVVNLGVGGYGTQQELLQLERFLESQPGVAIGPVIVIVYENDFLDVQRDRDPWLGRSKPRFDVVEGALVRRPFEVPASERLMDRSWLYWLLRSKYVLLTASPELTHEKGTEVVVACLRSMGASVERRGGHLLTLAYRHPGRRHAMGTSGWKSFLDASGAVDVTDRVLAGGPAMIAADREHWSPAGHAVVAGVIRERIGNGQVP